MFPTTITISSLFGEILEEIGGNPNLPLSETFEETANLGLDGD